MPAAAIVVSTPAAMKWPAFKAAPGSVEALREEAKHTVRNEVPTAAEMGKAAKHIVRNEIGLPNDQPTNWPTRTMDWPIQPRRVAVSMQ